MLNPQRMSNQQRWEAEYVANRYLRDASVEALERRSQDICDNMMTVNNTGQLSMGAVDQPGLFWMIMWTHLLYEMRLRGMPFGSAQMMRPDQFPWVSHPNAPRGLRILGKNTVSPHALVRMGQREHIKDAMNNGRVRIAPAGSYADPSLNPAIQDDELAVTAVGSGDTAIIQPIDPITGKAGDPIPAIGEITYSRRLQENFYVLCMTAGYTPRLLDDFSANALLVIHNVNRFLVRMDHAVRKARPDLTMAGRVVEYYDPYRVRPDNLDPFFAKNFRYAYQKEYRLVWHTPGLPLDCEPFFVEIGQMRDVASIHVLRD